MRDSAEKKPVTVSWDAPSNAVLVRFWGYADGESLRESLNMVVDLLISKRSNKLISDTLQMKALTQEDQRWIDEDWRPRARAAGLRRNAVLMPKSVVAQLSLTAITKDIDYFEFGYFSDLDEARRWLSRP